MYTNEKQRAENIGKFTMYSTAPADEDIIIRRKVEKT